MHSFAKKQVLRRFRKMFTSGGTGLRKNRISQFDQLEARRVLAAAMWHNARFPVDVSGDQPALVTPLDVLQVINALNSGIVNGTGGVQRFAYNVEVHGRLNTAPSGFTTEPLRTVAAESRYSYQAMATDSDGPSLAYSVDLNAADLDGGGNEEILAINESNDRLKLFVGDNLGGLTRQQDLLTGRAPRAVTTADLDGDGTLELIAADLDGDGRADLVALDDTDNALWIYTGNGTSILATPVALALGGVACKLTLAGATGDGLIDAIITLPETNRLMILPNRGLGFQPEISGAPIYITLSSSPSDVQVVDVNDDGNPDIAATLPNENTLAVFFGRGNNQFARPQQIRVGAEPTRVVLADADEDGRIDLIVSNSGDNTINVVYNRFDPNEVYRYDSDAIDPEKY